MPKRVSIVVFRECDPSIVYGVFDTLWAAGRFFKIPPSELAVSRLAFAERFTRAIGEPPMRCLARQRFEQASARLKDTADPIARIAYDVGYESEEAFNRAFRREYGAPPAAWRRANAAGRI